MRYLRSIWEERFLGLEAWLALFLALMLGLWVYLFQGAEQVMSFLQGQRVVLYRSLAAVASSLFGFSITAMSIVLALYSQERLELLRRSRHASKLWKTFFQSTQLLGGLALLSLICLLWDRHDHPRLWLVVLLVAVVSLTVLRLARAVWILQKIVSIMTEGFQSDTQKDA